MIGTIIIVIVCFFSIYFGYYLFSPDDYGDTKNENDMVTNKILLEDETLKYEYEEQEEQLQEKITPNTTIQYIYKNNGILTKTTAQKADNALVNLTEDELINILEDADITEFSSDLVVIESNKFDNAKHFIVGDNNGYVSIFNCDSNNNITLYTQTNIPVKTLPKEDIKMLNKGIEAKDSKELMKIIEDYTS